MADKTEINYDAVAAMEKRMKQMSSDYQALTKTTKSKVEDLHGGEWIGKGADKFFSEATGEVIPAMNRFADALNQAGEILNKVMMIYGQAEEETQSYFNSLGE